MELQSPTSKSRVHLCNDIYKFLLKLKNREQGHQFYLYWLELIMVALILGHSLPFGHINMNFVCEREYVIKCKMPINLSIFRKGSKRNNSGI